MDTERTSTPTARLSTYHIDLWEHASKLYHLLNWQQAVDIFEFLANDLVDTRRRTQCLINQALVEARLGDHNKAALTIANAAEVGEDWPITAFVAGLINCELSQLNLAEAWFEACLTGLDGRDIDYSEERLDFVLELATVRHNSESTNDARSAQELGYDDAAPDDLCFLPAELLFEAPIRSRESSLTASALPLEDRSIRDLLQRISVQKQAKLELPEVLSRVPSSAYSPAAMSRDHSLVPLICDELCGSPSRLSFEQRSLKSLPFPLRQKKHVSITINPAVALRSPNQASPASAARELRSLERIRQRDAAIRADPKSPSYPEAKIPYTWHGQQQKRHEPRDARAVSDSTNDLAHFVHEFAPEDPGPSRNVRAQRERPAISWDLPQADSPATASDEYEDVALRLGVVSSPKELERDLAPLRQRAATTGTDQQRPAAPRSTTPPARSSSLLRSTRSPKPGFLGRGHYKPSKIRWPFQDDHDTEPEPLPPPPPSVLANADMHAAPKPAPLDFIMGPDGKTVVLERAPKRAATVIEALQKVQEARLHGVSEREEQDLSASPIASPSPAPTSVRGKSVELPPMLQPTVYEPPAWRKHHKRDPPSSRAAHDNDRTSCPPSTAQLHSPTQTLTSLLSRRRRLNSLVPAPLTISRPYAHPQDPSAPFLLSSMPSQWPMQSAGAGGQAGLTGTSGTRRSGMTSHSIPSVVSSVNMWDYILDKIKPEGKR